MGKRELVRNTALLTGASVLMRLLGMLWQAWLARRAGAAGVGLYGLVMSVGFLFGTLARGAARFSVTRLLSEEIGRGREGSTGPVMLRAAAYARSVEIRCGADVVLEDNFFDMNGGERRIRVLRGRPETPTVRSVWDIR